MVVFPGEEWEVITPTEAGFDQDKWKAWTARQNPRGRGELGEGHPDDQWGVVLTRGGYIVQTWGDPDYRTQTASVGKAFTKLALQLTIDEGLVRSDEDLVMNYWTGEGELSHLHKYLNRGHHQDLTFRHLWQHRGGFPVTNGHYWVTEKEVPRWAKWTGDPGFDNYAHVSPGTVQSYSSGGYWRLAQALTAIWKKSLKEILDDKLLTKIGISPGRWDWLPGRQIHDSIHFYPEMPNYGAFVDPPYSIGGHTCVGGQWVVMSAKDLARVGLLIATGGVWRGERLISDTELLAGHGGANDSELIVQRHEMIVWARVTTAGITLPKGTVTSPLRKR